MVTQVSGVVRRGRKQVGWDRGSVPPNREKAERLPLAGLLALGMAAFVTLLTEIMPAGLLSAISTGMSISESVAGQFITAFAVGALISAIPVTAMTRSLRRKPLLLFLLGGFAAVNLITALSGNIYLTLAARFVAGLFGGAVWSMLAGYAVRMAPPGMGGRAIAISGAGATAALVVGVPLGSALGHVLGWQGAFGMVSGLAFVLMIWVQRIIPDFPGEQGGEREKLLTVLLRPGVAATTAVILTYIIGHNIIYIFVEPFLRAIGQARSLDLILLLFGIGSIGGLALVGALVDRHLTVMGPVQLGFFMAALAMWMFGATATLPIYLSAVIWGISFGGFGAVTQTAIARLAPDSMDVAQSMCTTAWNSAVALGGVAGGFLLDRSGAGSFPIVSAGILGVSLIILVVGVNRPLMRRR
ncbi:putative MFS family arabinose efflux permease [Novosphingobium sp. PhB55]|nr:putative MFS family arabinose efflux permease [Novosphingobium sp. PhB55]